MVQRYLVSGTRGKTLVRDAVTISTRTKNIYYLINKDNLLDLPQSFDEGCIHISRIAKVPALFLLAGGADELHSVIDLCHYIIPHNHVRPVE
jgi:hypothetical protein